TLCSTSQELSCDAHTLQETSSEARASASVTGRALDCFAAAARIAGRQLGMSLPEAIGKPRGSSAEWQQSGRDRLVFLPMTAKQAATKVLEIKLAHSADSDDAFMFYALATRKVRTPGLKFTHVLADIETLNQAASQELYDVSALSFSAFAYLRDRYVLLDCGASFGEGSGPMVVPSHPLKRDGLAGRRIAVPGLRTTAYLALKLFEPQIEPVPMAFDKILDSVRTEAVDAGLLI